MAKIKLKGHDSGTGVLTVTAPNTSTDRTITLPDSTGTLLTSDGDGSNLTGISSVGGATGVDFNDNTKARFGTGNDLEIYHDGSHSYVQDSGTGNLVLKGSSVRWQGSNGELMLVGDTDGAVAMYHNAAGKLATTATGIDVTGIMTDDRAFFSVASTNQNSGSAGTNHKVQWKQSAIIVDNHSGWDNSNYWWTVPSGHAGTYLITCNVGIYSTNTNQAKGRLMKNNDLLLENHFDANNANTSYHAISFPLTTIVSLAVGDDIWAQFYHADGSASSKDNSSSLVIMQLT